MGAEFAYSEALSHNRTNHKNHDQHSGGCQNDVGQAFLFEDLHFAFATSAGSGGDLFFHKKSCLSAIFLIL